MEADSTTLFDKEYEDDDLPHPVTIVNIDDDGHFSLNVDALSKILLDENIKDKHIAVLSIAGDFRKGKSFLLNFFLRYFEKPDTWLDDTDEPLKGKRIKPCYAFSLIVFAGFSWRSGKKRDTTGILMWSQPFIVKIKDGREVAVLLMDTQGTFDKQSLIRENATIFALSTMTSSIQIFNIMHNLQEDNLQILELFVEYGKMAMEDSDIKPFQTLMFLVRDWAFPYDDDYGLEGGANMLADYLAVEETQRPEMQRIRENLKSCFSEIKCCLMPYPGQKVATSSTFDGRISEIESEFVTVLSDLVKSLVSPDNLVVKNICGEELTGLQLFEYFKAYANIFKGETGPEAKTLLEANAEASNLAAYQIAKSSYMKSMEDICGGNKPYLSPDNLVKSHEKNLQAALDQFWSTRKIGGDKFSEPYFKRLTDEIKEAFEHFNSQNLSKNVFNILGSAFLLLIWAIFCYIVSSILEFIYLPVSNLFFMFATFTFAVEIAYMGSKLTGQYPQIVQGVDVMMTQVNSVLGDMIMNALQRFVQRRMAPQVAN